MSLYPNASFSAIILLDKTAKICYTICDFQIKDENVLNLRKVCLMNLKCKIENFYNYVVDMSKYHTQNIIEETSKFDGQKSYVLMFHQVEPKLSEKDNEYTITILGFMDLIETLISLEFQFCDVNYFVAEANGKKILLTFDDAYSGVYTTVFSFLKGKSIPFVVFQTCDLLDRDGFLSTIMIKKMLQYDKFTLGAHTMSHCNLHKSLSIENEIIAPIDFFYNKFGKRPEIFAYPYGAFVTIDTKAIKCVKKNYKYAFSTCRTYYRSILGEKKYLIPRININEDNYKLFLKSLIK